MHFVYRSIYHKTQNDCSMLKVYCDLFAFNYNHLLAKNGTIYVHAYATIIEAIYRIVSFLCVTR